MIFFQLLLLITSVNAVTLTYRMLAHEKPCFYATAERAGEKINVYFAVQSGGNYDVDFDLSAPDGTVIVSSTSENSVDKIVAAKIPGDYKFCFYNAVATFESKVVDFDITSESDAAKSRIDANPEFFTKTNPEEVKTLIEKVKPIESSVDNMRSTFDGITKDLRYFRTRENRNFATVKSTESRIFWFNIIQNCLILIVTYVQILVVQTLFSKRKMY
ncbi:hypothetical protein HDU79_001114 [Rhizoclosmatium sp. JEL0117]|nr:hypothetical protein HDU79_001114 [Rhizoclosmatium sp. JEL0117]